MSGTVAGDDLSCIVLKMQTAVPVAKVTESSLKRFDLSRGTDKVCKE